MKNIFQIIILICLLTLLCSTPFAASAPNLVNYQGTLTGADGKPLSTGDYKLKLVIYDAPDSSGVEQWSQEFIDTPVVRGYFNVLLGNNVENAFSRPDAFMEVTVQGGPVGGEYPRTITPRQQVLSAPYAIQAQNSADAKKLGGQTPQWYMPTGTVVAYWGTSAPDGWILCDGRTIPQDEMYNPLRTLLGGTTTPDLRDRFLRGKSIARSVGSYQADAFQGHTFGAGSAVLSWSVAGYKTAGTINGFYGTIDIALSNPPENENTTWHDREAGIRPFGRFGNPRYDSETRPENIAVNYIIKY